MIVIIDSRRHRSLPSRIEVALTVLIVEIIHPFFWILDHPVVHALPKLDNDIFTFTRTCKAACAIRS